MAEISVSVKFASTKFALGPMMYPPLSVLKITRYGVEKTGGVPDGDGRTCNRPDFVFVKFTFVKLIPSTKTNDMSVFVKLAPLKSILEPMIYPPLAEL